MAAAEAVVIANRHRQTVYHVILVFVGVFVYVRQQSKQGLPECFRNVMEPAVEIAFAEHSFDIAMFFEKAAASLLIAVKERHGHKRDGHHFGGGHFGLGGILMAPGRKKIVA